MRRSLPLLLVPLLLQGRQSAISFTEAQDGWILLFDGDTAFGWTGATTRWHFDNSAMACDASSGLLRTSSPFADYSLKLEFFNAGDNGPTLYLRTKGNGKPRDTGYVLNLGNNDAQWPGGSIVDIAKSSISRVRPNSWHTLKVDAIGENISVDIDGQPAASGSDPRAKAGYIALECGTERAQFRNVKLKPLTLQPVFDGTDLAGWKSVGTPPPKPKGAGLLSKMSKVMIPAPKAKQAEWSVKNNAIVGVKGPGQLESEAQYDNFVLRIAAPVPDQKNDHTKTAVILRGTAGQLASGYSIPLDNTDRSGGVAGLQHPRETLLLPGGTVYETIVADGRHIAVWMDGYPVTDWTDTRVDAPTPKTGARTAAGPIALEAPSGDSQVNIREVSLAALPKELGKQKLQPVAAAPPPPPVTPPPAATPAAATQPAANPQNDAALQMMQMQARQQQEEQAKKQQEATLMSQAVSTPDPGQRAGMYSRILQIDPTTVAAAQGFKDAQDKVEQQRAEQQKQQQEAVKQTQDQATKQQQFDGAMGHARQSFLRGNLSEASKYISIADRIFPGNPAAAALSQRISSAYALQSRIRWIAGGGGIVALLATIVYLWRRRKRGGKGGAASRQVVLEVVDGIDRGKRYTLNGDVSHIGAVQQDGGARNDIVVRDAERMVSRFHCEIHRKNGHLFLVDCNSSNGTFVDKKRVAPGKPVPLKNGSRVELGRTCALQVRFEKNRA